MEEINKKRSFKQLYAELPPEQLYAKRDLTPEELEKRRFRDLAEYKLYIRTWWDEECGPNIMQNSDGECILSDDDEIAISKIINNILSSFTHSELMEMMQDDKLLPFKPFVPRVRSEYREYKKSNSH